MTRVAVVTGGTRGIGAAISKALKAAGYRVAANYGGNDAAARQFNEETGIPVYKWDVSSYEDCAGGLKKVEADLGPVEVLVNNAGITRDTMFHKMKVEDWLGVTAPGGECWNDFCDRIDRALARVLAGPRPAAIVAHMVVNAALAWRLLGQDPKHFRQQYGEILTCDA